MNIRQKKKAGCVWLILILMLSGICACDTEKNSAESWETPQEILYQSGLKEESAAENISAAGGSAATGESVAADRTDDDNNTTVEQKGYDLPISSEEHQEAEDDCGRLMPLIYEIYETADRGEGSNVILSDDGLEQMQECLKKAGVPVNTSATYSNLENYRTMESFLQACEQGQSGSAVIYTVTYDGGICRKKYSFDGREMYVLTSQASWFQGKTPVVTNSFYSRIENWRYTEKGWFCYELCVPEPPEVNEIVDGSYLIRIRPMDEKFRQLSEQYVFVPGYQGNNLLRTDWDQEHMEDLDYNGLFEYFYAMKNQIKPDMEAYANGTPKEEFESLMMEYLPVTEEQLETYAVFDQDNGVYAWAGRTCLNYAPEFFGTSVPEVVGTRTNPDGTVTLTVDAVCDMVVCDDALITHEMTIRLAEDGTFQYLGNRILGDGAERIPSYQYRID